MQNPPTTPLAERLRPKTLSSYIGQEHLVGNDGPIKKAIKNKLIPSMILWGPPGVGKTTLAEIISNELDRPFYTLSAINSGVKDIRLIIDKVKNNGMFSQENAVLFIDEIHRFSKSQQDSLLAAVEKGIITLIGATTENPSFEVISALRSRCQTFVLKNHNKEELEKFLQQGLNDESIKKKNPILKEKEALIRVSGGDARKLLNALEFVINNVEGDEILITNELVTNTIQQNISKYDKKGEMHYDIISAFIKSIRGSDPNGAVYWLARMVHGGEDPKFIARRMIILASEDIGLANPTALIMANNCFDAVQKIGWPEGRIVLSQCAVYLAASPKSNSTYMAINNALNEIEKSGDLAVPLHLRNAPTKLMQELNYGQGYKYSHDHKESNHQQEFLPKELADQKFYNSGFNKREKELKNYLNHIWKGKYNY